MDLGIKNNTTTESDYKLFIGVPLALRHEDKSRRDHEMRRLQRSCMQYYD